MTKITTVLFDFDGVIADTEPQYDIYMDDLGVRYNLGIDNLAALVKGVPSKNIFEKYFGHFSSEQKERINNEMEEFERQMHYPPINGAIGFIDHLKTNGYKIGLVTSSQNFKMEIALGKLNLTEVFHTEVTADRITEGKPNPMCYLLAAKDLGVAPEECLVFEDSFFGIRAGLDAGMRVVGVSSTIAENELKGVVDNVIPDFSNLQNVLAFLD